MGDVKIVQGSSMGDIGGVKKSCSERQTRFHVQVNTYIAIIWSNGCLTKRVNVRSMHYFLFLLLRYTCNMCLLFSSACFRDEYGEKS